LTELWSQKDLLALYHSSILCSKCYHSLTPHNAVLCKPAVYVHHCWVQHCLSTNWFLKACLSHVIISVHSGFFSASVFSIACTCLFCILCVYGIF